MATSVERKALDIAHLLDVVLEIDEDDHPICLSFKKHSINRINDLLILMIC